MNNNIENKKCKHEWIVVSYTTYLSNTTKTETYCKLCGRPYFATNLHIEENNSVVVNENVFNAENYHGSKEHFNDIANGRD